MPQLAISRRTRSTAFSDRVAASGVSAYTVYNHMLLPACFVSLEEDYRHLKSAVQIWDVACERQVEITGPDAFHLIQLMTPRDLSRQQIGQCSYAPICDDAGRILNDPVVLKLSEDRFWVSIADSDILLFAKGLAIGMGLAVTVHEPDVSPLAVQGPQADLLMERAFGHAVHRIGFFRFARLAFAGMSLIVARSGYSGQGGFEIYLEGADNGATLWDGLMAAGEGLDVRAGGPNLIERIEAGLLSYGNDMTRAHSPYEAGLGRYCQPERVHCVASDALIAEAQTGPARQIRFLEIHGAPLPPLADGARLTHGGQMAGFATSGAYSPDFGVNIAVAMVERAFWNEGTSLDILLPTGARKAYVSGQPIKLTRANRAPIPLMPA